MNGYTAEEVRQMRGEQIAATCTIIKTNGTWAVPSQSGNGKYKVYGQPQRMRCSCPDYEERECKCKHIFAVEYVIERKRNKDGSVTTRESITIEAPMRKTYAQDWPAYNAAQTGEKEQFQGLLHDLCKGIENPVQTKGRPRLPLSDAVFSITFKIYSTFSGRRFIGDLTDAHAKGYISKVPHFNSIFNYLENPDLEPLLTDLIIRSSLPLKAVETDFAVDSTGFMSCRFVRWYDHKYGGVKQQHDWVKCHLMCGVKTNVVTSVEIHDRDANDGRFLPSLVETTAESFKISEVSADKAYGTLRNLNAIVKAGGAPFIAFKSNATGARGGLWADMFHYFSFKRSEFMARYHKRSNIESTVGMIKAKFRDHLRSKTDTAMRNEVLCKILCHNICCLISAIHELGLAPTFEQISSTGSVAGCNDPQT